MTASTSEPWLGRSLVLVMSLVLGSIGLFWIVDAFIVDGQLRLGNPPPPELIQPRQVRAEVTRVEGSAGVSVGDECVFFVERHELPKNHFQCRAQVLCGGVLLYGGPQRGYFACVLPETPRREIVGTDPATTRADGDSALHLDTVRGILRIRDDAYGTQGKFAVEAEVLDVR